MKYKTRVLLVRPLIREYVNSQSSSAFEKNIGLVPPLNLCCLAAEIKKAGFDVDIYDCEANDNSTAKYSDYLSTARPDVVGISIITTNFKGALHTAQTTKSVLPNVKVVCGGTHMMIFKEETMAYPDFDYGFVGEAEIPFRDFLIKLENGDNDFSKIPGLLTRSNGQLVANDSAGFNNNLDQLPFPAYEKLDLSHYSMPNIPGRVISLFLSRGCPFSCGFCYRNPLLQKVRFKSVKRAVEEIAYMHKNFNVESVNFVDETISFDKNYFLEFCRELESKKLKISWQSPTRVTSIDEDIIRAARNSGCHTFRLGIESGTNEVLNKINKGITVEKSREAVRLCRKYGIKTVAYFIIGYLGETERTIKKTIQFAKSIMPDYAAFFPATPMPDTRLGQECEELGLIPKDYWKDFVSGKRNDALPFIFPDAGQWTSAAYKQFYFSPQYILKQMKTPQFYKNFFSYLRIAFNLLHMNFKRGKK